MAIEINLKQFESNAKKYNKRGLNRGFYSIAQSAQEYVKSTPLAATSDYVLEVSIDKGSADDFQKYLKRKKYKVLGAKNYHHIGKMVEKYNAYEKSYSSLKEKIEAISKDYELMKKSKDKYSEMPNDDVKFYFLPYNDDVTNLSQFVEAEKNNIVKWCKKNDITIIMNIVPYCNMARGFLGFNFLDDQAEGEVVVDFLANIQVGVNMNDRMSVYAAALLLSGVGQTESDLATMNCQIIAEEAE